jgi:hypothetical protein
MRSLVSGQKRVSSYEQRWSEACDSDSLTKDIVFALVVAERIGLKPTLDQLVSRLRIRRWRHPLEADRVRSKIEKLKRLELVEVDEGLHTLSQPPCH